MCVRGGSETRHSRSIVHFALDLVGSSLDTSGKEKNSKSKKRKEKIWISSFFFFQCPRLPLFFQENLHDRWRCICWERDWPRAGGGVKVFSFSCFFFSPTFFSSLKVLLLLLLLGEFLVWWFHLYEPVGIGKKKNNKFCVKFKSNREK